MPDKNININVRDLSKGGRGVTTPAKTTDAQDPRALKRLENSFKKATSDLSKSLEKSFEKAIKTGIKQLPAAQQAKGQAAGSGADKAAWNLFAKRLAAELASQMLKQLGTKGPKPTAAKSEEAIFRAIGKGIEKQVQQAINKLNATLKKQTGMELDKQGAKILSDSITGSIEKAVPLKSLTQAVKELKSSVGAIKSIVREVGTLVAAAAKIRKTGGGVELSEIGPLLTSIKRLTGEIAKLPLELKRARESGRAVIGEGKESYKEFSKALTDLRRATREKVVRVKERAQADPQKYAKLIAKELSSAISKMPAMKGTKIEKILVGLDKKIETVGDITKSIKGLEKEIAKQIKGRKITIEGAEALLTSMDKLTKSLKGLPKEMGGAKADKTLRSLEKFVEKTGVLVETLKISFDEKALTKQVESVAKKAKPQFEKAVKEGIKKGATDALKEVSSKTKIEINIKARTKYLERQINDLVKDLKIKTDDAEILKLVETIDWLKGKLDALQKLAEKPIKVNIQTIGKPTEEKVKRAGINIQGKLKKLQPYDEAEVDKLVRDIDKLFKEAVTARRKDIKRDAAKGFRTKESAFALKELRKSYKEMDVPKLRKITTVGLGRASTANEPLREMGKLITLLEGTIGKDQEVLRKIFAEVSDTMGSLEKEAKRTTEELSSMSDVLASTKGGLENFSKRLLSPEVTRSAIETFKVYGYKKQTIEPAEELKVEPTKKVLGHGEKARKAVEANVSALAKSLKDLQEDMAGSLAKELSKGATGWEIVRKSEKQAIGEYFKLATGGVAGNIKTAGKQWVLQIANIKEMKKQLGKGYEAFSPPKLLEAFKELRIKEQVGLKIPAIQPKLIAEWIKTASEETIRGLESITEQQKKGFVDIKRNVKFSGVAVSDDMSKAVESLLGDATEVEKVFKNTYAKLEAEKELVRGIINKVSGAKEPPVLKALAIPAAKVTEMGATIFETAAGAERALPKFATFKTGFERMYEILEKSGRIEVEKEFAPRIKEVGIRATTTSAVAEAEKLAREMLKSIAAIPEQKGFVTGRYRSAVAMRGLEIEKEGIGTTQELAKQIENVIDRFVKVPGSIDDFMTAMNKTGISAFDVAKSLDRLKFENVYDILGQVLKAGPLKEVGESPKYDRPIRHFETAVRQLEQILPLIEAGRPRRGTHQEAIVQLLARRTPAVYEGTKVGFNEQKKFIKEINLRLGEMVREAEALRKVGGPAAETRLGELRIPETIKELSTLGVPESLAGAIKELRPKYGDEETEYLKGLHATTLKLYTENLRELAPFGAQFQNWARNITNVSNAMTSASEEVLDKFGRTVEGTKTEFPTLRTERERELISGGRYGRKGYGFNVLAELRTTANTFEDQVVISGKIADALTSITKTLIKPGKDIITGTTEIEPKALRDITNTIENVSKEIQSVLGMEDVYKGRADKALITAVTSAITVVRGKDIEVQAAKLAEVFLNYFGRKITTRYGSKGVAITPTNIKEVLQYYGEKPVKVLPKAERTRAGLGVAVMPKTMGQLASEILSKEAKKLEEKGMASADVKRLSTAVITSGNKFMIGMFKQAGVIAEDEIKVQKGIFTKLQNALKQLDIDLASDVEGIERLKKVYKERVGKELYVEKPIDIRISAAGLAKRGLQTEVLESIMANIAGVGPGGVTTLKTAFKPEVYEKMLTGRKVPGEELPEPGMLSKYTTALGFESALVGRERESAYKQLVQEFTKKFGEGKEDIAKRAAELEALSNFYVEVIDELSKGKPRKGLVGPKFVQIVEEPTLYPEWETKAIEKGIKGEKIDLPAFGAYAAIFGEQSEFMKELRSATTIDTKEAWEYVKALQTVNKQNVEFRGLLMTPLETKDLLDIKSFEASTGTIKELEGTILDLKKYPEAFKLRIPTTEKGAKEEYEELYIPGALARGTYEEPLLAGERAPKGIARRLAHLVNMAKEAEKTRMVFASVEKEISDLEQQLEEVKDPIMQEGLFNKLDSLKQKLEKFYSAPENVEKMKESITKFVGSMVQVANKASNINKVMETIEKLMPALSEELPPVEGFRTVGMTVGFSEKEHITALKERAKSLKDYKNVVSSMSDIIIGVSEGSKEYLEKMREDLASISKLEEGKYKATKEQQLSKKYPGKGKLEARLKRYIDRYEKRIGAVTTVMRSAETEKLATLASKLGMTMESSETQLSKDLAALSRAKIDYYYELAKTVLGKKGSVAEILFSRKIPAVMGKAISAIVDKTEDLKNFSRALRDISKEAGDVRLDELGKVADDILKIETEHRENIKKYKERGIPVLKQYELGVPERYAKKIPVEYTKKYAVTEGEVKPIKPELIKGKLFDLLKYIEDLTAKPFAKEKLGGVTGFNKIAQDRIRKHIEQELVPYIESVRYPFTGVSSVQPYRAKLMKGEMAGHALAVPGMPEMDIEKFDELIKKVRSVVDELEKERKDLSDLPEEIEKRRELTVTIDALNRAISDVLPKYIAHQQKLDYDGDAIEIHSATTGKARLDIKKHFDSLAGDIDSTRAVFRDFFTYEAKQPTTGKYPLGEMLAAFEKKFPTEKGFGFLKKPHLTKELEYLKPEEQLKILSQRPKVGTEVDVLKRIIEEVVREPEEQKRALDAIDASTAKGASSSEDLIKIVMDVGKDVGQLVKEGIKTRTFEEKYKDALEAQLYKIHTGPETEAFYRIIRMLEMKIGFAGGMIAPTAPSRATEEFKERWPRGKALEAPEIEIHTMMNELMRFALQKGMDVKHAGEAPVAGEIVTALSRGEEDVEKLIKRITDGNEEVFSELHDFVKHNEIAIRRKLERLPTKEIREEAIAVKRGRGLETAGVEKEGREYLIQEMVGMVGFKGFLRELAKQIKEEAIEGLINEVRSLPPTKRPVGAGGDIRVWAKRELETEIKERGKIDIAKHITAQRQPLYTKRIFSATPAAELAAFGGEMKTPEFRFAGMKKENQKRYIKQYKEAQATAINLAEEFKRATEMMGGGAYAQMVTSAIENVYEVQQKINDELLSKLRDPKGFEANIPDMSMVERVLGEEGVANITRGIIGDPKKISDAFLKKMEKEVAGYSDLVGLPMLNAAEKFEIEHEALQEFGKKAASTLIEEGMSEDEFKQEVEKVANAWVRKAQAVAQLDKIIKVLKTKPYEENLLRSILPSPENIKKMMSKEIVKPVAEKTSKLSMAERESIIERFVPKGKERLVEERGLASAKGAIERGILPKGFKDCMPITNCGKPLDVYVVGADSSVSFDVGQGKALTGALRQQAKTTDDISNKFKELSKYTEEATGGLNKLSGATFETVFRASGLGAGGVYGRKGTGGRNQLQAIMEAMLVSKEEKPMGLEAAGFLGTALHAKIGKSLKEEYGTDIEIEKFVKYRDELAGDITGHIDAVFKDAFGQASKIVDIKTVEPRLMAGIEKFGGKEISFEDIISKDIGPYTRQKLEDAASQINFYIKALAESTGNAIEDISGEVRFYSRWDKELKTDPVIVKFGKFDPQRFKRDIEAVRKARELIQKYIMGTEIPEGIDKQYDDIISRVKKTRKAEFAPTASIEQLEKLDGFVAEMTDKRIAEFVESATEVYGKLRPDVLASKGKPAHVKIMAEREKVREAKKVQAAAGAKLDLGEFELPKIITGTGLNAVHKALVELHKEAERAQSELDVDFEDVFAGLPDRLKELISQIRETGRAGGAGSEFNEVIGELKEAGDIGGRDIGKAWKLYRMAVGEFYIKRITETKEALMAADKDSVEMNRAYASYKKTIEQFRSFIIGSLGKATDIYTREQKYISPELAKTAKVYLPPEKIREKAAGPLGEEDKLIEIFDKLVEDIRSGKALRPPILKARDVVATLSNINKEVLDLANNADKVARQGEKVSEAWDFGGLIGDITRLRAALKTYLRYNVRDDFTVEQRKNLMDVNSYLGDIERTFSKLSTKADRPEWGATGVSKVPKWLDPTTQLALHKKNLAGVREYFKKAAEMGGPKTTERFTYMINIFDQAGQRIKNMAHDFHKYGEYVNRAGEVTSAFSEKQRDLMVYTQGANRTFRAAIRRVAMWGGAATLVYGGISQLKNMIGTIADVEMGVAQLRMVMSPLETDFDGMSKAAIGFAKQYGVPMTDVLKGMRIFAQQGLKQEEVIERTQTSTLAANVTTLGAKEATEALTAAMKVFRQEGESSLSFMDAWSEVEAKHAITSADMANALKKSASAGKNAGFTFDELNGIVAGIGSVTRQTGKEVGTALRFIFRRLTSEKGPKELAKIGIPVLTETGELRKGYKVLSDLSKAWKDLTSAQKMSIAQAIGGTRQYNALLVLMDNWEEAVSATRDSINSKGSAERRNLEVMKTYTKQLQQTKQAAIELQMEFGKVYLPIAKFGLKGTKFLLESLSAIPISVKGAAVALGLLITYIAKGDKLIGGLSNQLIKGSTVIGGFFDAFSKGTKVAGFEVFGKGKGKEFEGLKTIGQEGVKGIKDFHSALGKTAYVITEAGTAYNKFIGNIVTGSGSAVEAVGETTEKIGKNIALFNQATIEATYGGYKGIQTILSKQGWKGLVKAAPKVLGAAAAVGVEAAGQSAMYAGKAIDTLGEKMGGVGQKFLKGWASQNTGFVKATVPMIASIMALVPAFKAVYGYYGKTTKSAQDYEKSMYGVRRANESELSTIRDLINEYDGLSDKLEDIRKVSKPEVKARRMELGTYESPLLSLGKLQEDAIDTANKLAGTNINLISGYDKLGNAVLKTVGDFKEYLKTLEKLKIKEMAKTEVSVLEKYIKDLTEIEGPEKWKFELKKLLKEAPVFGEIIGKHIKISPAKALDEVTKKLNALIALKNKFPISTAFDKDIKKYQLSLKEVKKGFSSTYRDFRKILSEVPTVGLGRKEVAKLFGREELRKGYQLILEMEPRLQIKDVKGKAKWEDVLGAEVLKKIFPAGAPVIDVTSMLTEARLETAGIKPRAGKALSGDILMFLDDVVDQYNIAGKQAVLSLKETSDGIFEWMVTYFNTKTLDIEERPFTKDMQQLVENIFPMRAIEEDLSERVEVFNEFVAGAAAGLRGISAKDFKRQFGLGERFFADIPTTTIMQGPKGYAPGAGGGTFGMSPYQKEWKQTTEQYFFKPMREYRLKAEQLEKLRLEGLEGTRITLATGLYEELNKLQEVLKNNQVVLQYRAVFVDLTKTIEQSTRAMQENLAAEKSRLELEQSVGGYLKGIPEGLDNLDVGVQKFSDLTARQRSLLEEPGYKKTGARYRGLGVEATGIREQIYAADKAIVALDSIRDVSKGFGAALSPEDMKKYTEVVARTGDKGIAELAIDTKKTTENTADTVDRLDKILENMGDEEAIERMMSSMTDYLNIGMGTSQKTINALERVARIREKAMGAGNQEMVIAANKTLDVLSKTLVEQVGVKKAMELVEDNFTIFSKRFTKGEMAQRAFGGIDLKTFSNKMEKAMVGGRKWDWRSMDYITKPSFEQTKEIKKLYDLQKDDSKTQWISSKSLIKGTAALATFEQFNKKHSSSVIKQLEEQRDAALVNIEEAKKQGKPITEFSSDLKNIDASLVKERKDLDFHRLVQGTSVLSGALMAFAKSAGASEGTIKLLGTGAGSTYVAMKLLSGLTGEELPKSFHELNNAVKSTAKSYVAEGKSPSTMYEGAKAKVAGKEFYDEFKKRVKEVKTGEYAAGGLVVGPGGPKDDEVLLKASKGEYIIKEPSTKKMGHKKLNYINKYGELPKFAEGGVVGNVASEAGAAITEIKLDLSENSINRLKQLLATYLVATGAGYVAGKSDEKTRVATLNKRAEEQSEVFAGIIEKYPHEAQKVIDGMEHSVKEMEETARVARRKVPTETRSLVLDTEKERKEIAKNIEKVRKTLKKEHERITRDLEKQAEKLASIEMAKQFEIEMEAMEKAVRDLKIAETIERELRGALVEFDWRDTMSEVLKFPGAAGKLAGKYRSEPIDFGIRSVEEMTPEDYMIYKGKEIEYTPKGEFMGSWEDFKLWFKGVRELKGEYMSEALKETGTMTRTRSAEKFFQDLSRMTKETEIKRMKLEEQMSKKIELERIKGKGDELTKAEEEEIQRFERSTRNLTDELIELTEDVARTKDRLRKAWVEAEAEQFIAIREREYEIAKSIDRFTFEMQKYAGKGFLKEPLSGIEIDLGPRTLEELSPGEFAELYTKEKEKGIFFDDDTYRDYGKAISEQQELMESGAEIRRKIAEAEYDEDEHKFDVWNKNLKENKEQMKENQEEITKLTEKLREFSDESKSVQDAYGYALEQIRQRRRFELGGKFGETALWSKEVKGFPGAPSFGPIWEEMSAGERVFATSTDKMKEAFRTFKFYQDQTSGRVDYLAGLEDRRDALKREIMLTKESGKNIGGLERQYNNLNKQIEEQKKVMGAAASEWAEYGRKLKKALAFEEIVKNAEDAMRRLVSQEAVERMPGMREAERTRAMLYGGGHPRALAMVLPEERRAGAEAGVRLRRFEDPMQIERARLTARLHEAEGANFLKVEQALTDLTELFETREAGWEQQRENRMLLRQGDTFNSMIDNLGDFLMRTDLAPEEREAVAVTQQKIVDMMSGFYKGRTREELLKEAVRVTGKPTDEAFVSALDSISKLKPGEIYRGALPFEQKTIKEEYEGLKDVLGVKAEAPITPQMEMLKGVTVDPITARQEVQIELLKIIADGVGADKGEIEKLLEELSKRGKQYEEGIKGPQRKEIGDRSSIKRMWDWIVSPKPGSWRNPNKQDGGRMFGPGGPREDEIPAYLSPGEFVIRQAAARRLGYENLDYMNEEGKIPGFADGGVAKRFKILPGGMSEFIEPEKGVSAVLGKAIKTMQEQRLAEVEKEKKDILSHLGSLAFQGQLASAELLTRLTKMPVDTAKMLGSAFGYVKDKNLTEMYAGASKTAVGIKDFVSNLNTEQIKSMAGGIASAAKEDIEKGGMGMTSGVLAALVPSGLLTKIGKGKRIIPAKKDILKKTKTLPEPKITRAAEPKWLKDLTPEQTEQLHSKFPLYGQLDMGIYGAERSKGLGIKEAYAKAIKFYEEKILKTLPAEEIPTGGLQPLKHILTSQKGGLQIERVEKLPGYDITKKMSDQLKKAFKIVNPFQSDLDEYVSKLTKKKPELELPHFSYDVSTEDEFKRVKMIIDKYVEFFEEIPYLRGKQKMMGFSEDIPGGILGQHSALNESIRITRGLTEEPFFGFGMQDELKEVFLHEFLGHFKSQELHRIMSYIHRATEEGTGNFSKEVMGFAADYRKAYIRVWKFRDEAKRLRKEELPYKHLVTRGYSLKSGEAIPTAFEEMVTRQKGEYSETAKTTFGLFNKEFPVMEELAKIGSDPDYLKLRSDMKKQRAADKKLNEDAYIFGSGGLVPKYQEGGIIEYFKGLLERYTTKPKEILEETVPETTGMLGQTSSKMLERNKKLKEALGFKDGSSLKEVRDALTGEGKRKKIIEDIFSEPKTALPPVAVPSKELENGSFENIKKMFELLKEEGKVNGLNKGGLPNEDWWKEAGTPLGIYTAKETQEKQREYAKTVKGKQFYEEWIKSPTEGKIKKRAIGAKRFGKPEVDTPFVDVTREGIRELTKRYVTDEGRFSGIKSPTDPGFSGVGRFAQQLIMTKTAIDNIIEELQDEHSMLKDITYSENAKKRYSEIGGGVKHYVKYKDDINALLKRMDVGERLYQPEMRKDYMSLMSEKRFIHSDIEKHGHIPLRTVADKVKEGMLTPKLILQQSNEIKRMKELEVEERTGIPPFGPGIFGKVIEKMDVVGLKEIFRKEKPAVGRKEDVIPVLDKYLKKEMAKFRGPTMLETVFPALMLHKKALRKPEDLAEEQIKMLLGGFKMGLGKIPEYQTGGIVPENQLAFLHKGEQVIPAAITKSGNGIDFEGFLTKLEGILEDAELKVEDKEFKMEDKKIEIDLRDSEDRLKNAMTAALTSAGGASVGAERLDSLESLISEVNNKVLSVKGQMDDEITMLDTKIDSTNSIMETNIQARIHALITDIEKDLNEVRSNTSGTDSEVVRTKQHLETLIDEVKRIAVETRNLIGRG